MARPKFRQFRWNTSTLTSMLSRGGASAGAERGDLNRSVVSLILSLIGTELDERDGDSEPHQ